MHDFFLRLSGLMQMQCCQSVVWKNSYTTNCCIHYLPTEKTRVFQSMLRYLNDLISSNSHDNTVDWNRQETFIVVTMGELYSQINVFLPIGKTNLYLLNYNPGHFIFLCLPAVYLSRTL